MSGLESVGIDLALRRNSVGLRTPDESRPPVAVCGEFLLQTNRLKTPLPSTQSNGISL